MYGYIYYSINTCLAKVSWLEITALLRSSVNGAAIGSWIRLFFILLFPYFYFFLKASIDRGRVICVPNLMIDFAFFLSLFSFGVFIPTIDVIFFI